MKVSRLQLMTSGVVVVLIAGVSLGAMALGRATARGSRPAITYSTEAPAAWRVLDEDGANGRHRPGLAGEVDQRFALGEIVKATGRIARVQGESWREVETAGGETLWVLTAYLGRVDGGPVTPPTTTPPTTPPTTTPPTTTPPTTTPPTTTPPTTTPPTTVPPTPVFDTEDAALWQVEGISSGGVLNVRSGPGVHHPVIARFAHDHVEIRSTGIVARLQGSLWRQVEYRTGQKGWVNAAFLERYVAPPVFGTEKPGLWDVTGLSAGDKLNVRSGPGTTHPAVAGLAHDVTAVASTGRVATVSGALWREVKYDGSGKTGWVSARYLTAHVPPAPKPTPRGTIVMGDWLGTGVRTPGVFRDGVWYLRFANSKGPADLVFEFGAAGDKPVVGDWDGDGVETPGVVRGGVWHLRNANSAGPADVVFTYGDPGDRPVAGDWDGDGVDSPGVVRGNRWMLRNSPTRGGADLEFAYGDASDRAVAGDWDGDGVDSPGVVRGSALHLRNRLSAGTADLAFTYDPPAKS